MDRNIASSSADHPGKQGRGGFKIKIPFKKVTGKQQAVGDANAVEGTTPSNAETSKTCENSSTSGSQEGDACIPSATLNQPESMSTPSGATEEDLKPILVQDSKKSEVQPTQPSRYTRTRSSSFDIREDLKVLNTGLPGEEKHSRPPTNNNHGNELNAPVIEHSTLPHRPGTLATDSKEVREPVTNIFTSSFLDSLNEEERRVRTRHLPAVTGFHRLHKKEINHDLATVKNMIKSMSSTQPRARRVVSDESGSKYGDKMDTAEDEVMAALDEDNSSDTSEPVIKGSTKASVIMDDNMDHNISTFSAPFPDSHFVLTELDDLPSQKSNYRQYLLRSPEAVESLTTFNPPRPPESVGAKKKHRLARWEKNPQDIEKDLINYRKTVRRTKEELQKTMREREHLETVGSFIRSLLMHHINGMRVEGELLTNEVNQLQAEAQRLIDGGDTKMKTRHKGSNSKVNCIMKDVMSFLSSNKRWQSFSAKESNTSSSDPNDKAFTSGLRFPLDWLVRGDRVSTPYGEGSVLKLIGPTAVGSDHTMSVYPARVCVRLSYGLAFLSPLNIHSLEKPSIQSIENLSKRWMMMLESATEFSTCVDEHCNKSLGNISFIDENTKLNESNNAGAHVNSLRLGLLANHPTESLCRIIDQVFDSDRCVLAEAADSYIADNIRETEERRREIQVLEGKVLQMRNEVSRQRKLRMAAERSLSMNQDRTHRCESLLLEMQSDLINLKERLSDDLVELGVDEEKAAEILSDFYRDHFANGSSPTSLRKRKYDDSLEGKSDLLDVSPTRLNHRFAMSVSQDDEHSVDLENDDRL